MIKFKTRGVANNKSLPRREEIAAKFVSLKFNYLFCVSA
jgi:hypothetical protein